MSNIKFKDIFLTCDNFSQSDDNSTFDKDKKSFFTFSSIKLHLSTTFNKETNSSYHSIFQFTETLKLLLFFISILTLLLNIFEGTYFCNVKNNTL